MTLNYCHEAQYYSVQVIHINQVIQFMTRRVYQLYAVAVDLFDWTSVQYFTNSSFDRGNVGVLSILTYRSLTGR
jgi:uncharacterized protein (DUF39 family)